MIEPWVKLCYTALLCLNHMAFAMSCTAIGPVLTEMVDILQTSPQYMTMFTTFTSTGFLIGSFFCFLLKYLNRQLVWVTFLVVMAISVALVPHSPNLLALYTLAIGIGMGAGVLNTIINVWIIEMWKNNSPSILQIPGLTFGIGTILSPLIIKPFLREGYSGAQQNSTSINKSPIYNSLNVTAPESESNSVINGYNEVYEEWRRSLLTTPFIILGLIQALFPLLMSVMFFVKPYEYSAEKQESKALNKPIVVEEHKLFDRQRQHRRTVIVLFAILLGVFNINECMYYTFAPTYFQYSPLQQSAPKAAEMITSFTIPYTVFRGLSCLIAVKVLPKYMLSAHYTVSIIGITLLMFARNSETFLWLANIVVGIGLSALMQTTFAFVGQHIHMTDKIGTILVVVLGSFNIAPPYVLGLFIKDYSFVFIMLEGFSMIICIILFVILLLFICKYEKLDKLKKLSGLI